MIISQQEPFLVVSFKQPFFPQVRYTGYRDRPADERIVRFQAACREGHTEIAFTATGTNLQLVFAPPTTGYMSDKECDFDKEQGKVSTQQWCELFTVICQSEIPYLVNY